MVPFCQIQSPTHLPPPGVYPPTHLPGYTYQPTYLPTYAHPATYLSRDMPWDPNLLTSTNMSTNLSPVNTICKQDTHRLPSISKSQYSSRSGRTRPPAILNVSDAQTPAQAWELPSQIYDYDPRKRYAHVLSLLFQYWTSQDVSRRCVIINLTSPSTIA